MVGNRYTPDNNNKSLPFSAVEGHPERALLNELIRECRWINERFFSDYHAWHALVSRFRHRRYLQPILAYAACCLTTYLLLRRGPVL